MYACHKLLYNVWKMLQKEVRRLFIFLYLQTLYFYLWKNLMSTQQMCCFYLVKPVEGGAFLHELRQVLLPVELVGLRHGCSQTWDTKERRTDINNQVSKPMEGSRTLTQYLALCVEKLRKHSPRCDVQDFWVEHRSWKPGCLRVKLSTGRNW